MHLGSKLAKHRGKHSEQISSRLDKTVTSRVLTKIVDDGQRVIRLTHPELCSGELIKLFLSKSGPSCSKRC